MNWSLGEIRSLAFKASRGAGLEWGEAEELAQIVYSLQQNRLPGVAALKDYLTRRAGPLGLDQDLDPLLLAIRLCDQGEPLVDFKHRVYQPVLLAFAVSQLAGEATFEMRFGTAHLLISAGAICDVNGFSCRFGEEEIVSISQVAEAVPEAKTSSRFICKNCACFKALDTFAHKTYAPATEASRSSGAGAGNDAND